MKSAISLFALCSLLIMQSCTIEKRHYNSGFHVEWNHQSKQNTTVADTSKGDSATCMNEPEIKTQVGVATEPDKRLETKSENATVVPDKSEARIEGTSVKKEKTGRLFTTGLSTITNRWSGQSLEREVPVKHQGAKKSLISGLIPYLIMGIQVMRNSGLIFLPIGVSLLLGIGALVFALLAIIMGSAAQKSIDAEPGKFSNRTDATAGMVLGIVYLALLILLLILVVILITALL